MNTDIAGFTNFSSFGYARDFQSLND